MKKYKLKGLLAASLILNSYIVMGQDTGDIFHIGGQVGEKRSCEMLEGSETLPNEIPLSEIPVVGESLSKIHQYGFLNPKTKTHLSELEEKFRSEYRLHSEEICPGASRKIIDTLLHFLHQQKAPLENKVTVINILMIYLGTRLSNDDKDEIVNWLISDNSQITAEQVILGTDLFILKMLLQMVTPQQKMDIIQHGRHFWDENENEVLCNLIMPTPEQFKNPSYDVVNLMAWGVIEEKGTPGQKILSAVYKEDAPLKKRGRGYSDFIEWPFEDLGSLELKDLLFVLNHLNRTDTFKNVHVVWPKDKKTLTTIQDLLLACSDPFERAERMVSLEGRLEIWQSLSDHDRMLIRDSYIGFFGDHHAFDQGQAFDQGIESMEYLGGDGLYIQYRVNAPNREFVRVQFMYALGGKYREKAFEACEKIIDFLVKKQKTHIGMHRKICFLIFDIINFLKLSGEVSGQKILKLAKSLYDECDDKGFTCKNDPFFFSCREYVPEGIMKILCSIDIEHKDIEVIFKDAIHNQTCTSHSGQAYGIKFLSTLQSGRYKYMALDTCYEVLKRVGIERDKDNNFIVTEAIEDTKELSERKYETRVGAKAGFREIPILLETIFEKEEEALQIYTQLLTDYKPIVLYPSRLSIFDLTCIRKKRGVERPRYNQIDLINAFIEPVKAEFALFKKVFDDDLSDDKSEFKSFTRCPGRRLISLEGLYQCTNALLWDENLSQQLRIAACNFDSIYRELSDNKNPINFEGVIGETKTKIPDGSWLESERAELIEHRVIDMLEEIIIKLGYKPGFSEEILFK